jgi:homocysteine S-methyltransferase
MLRRAPIVLLSEEAKKAKVLLMDGGMGEELFLRGLPDDRKTWSSQALLNPVHHSLVKQIHKDMILSGSCMITTNNFAVVRATFKEGGDKVVAELTSIAGQLAVEARNETKFKDSVRILGSLPPLNGCYRPDLVLPPEQCHVQYEVILKALLPYVDGIICETLSSTSEMLAAVSAVLAQPAAVELPLLASWSVGRNVILVAHV